MKIGLIDVDGHNFPSIPLMKISAWHKQKGDEVAWYEPLIHGMGEPLDVVYMSKVFGAEYTQDYPYHVNAKKIVKGGTGYFINVESGVEIFDHANHKNLNDEIEHMFPDYSIYPEHTKNTAYGFLTRGCCNNCDFCIVSKKEGRCSKRVADLYEFWNGQKFIKLLDPNILACKEHMYLLNQLSESGAFVDFTQGLDAKFVNDNNLEILNKIKIKRIHFAFDTMKNEKKIVDGLKKVKEKLFVNENKMIVYILTNYDTTFDQDIYRIKTVRELGYLPDVRIYRKNSLPKNHILRHLQRWCNNRFVFKSCDFMDYTPWADGLTIKQLMDRKEIVT